MLYGNVGSAAKRRMIKTMSRIVLIASSSSDDLRTGRSGPSFRSPTSFTPAAGLLVRNGG
jgi:hypothetical protein